MNVENLAARIAAIADKAQAAIREYARELDQLPNGMNGEFTELLNDKAADVDAIADELERIIGDEGSNTTELLEAASDFEEG